MARDKRKVVIQSDNEARHSPRQKRVRPFMQSRSGVVISEPTERHVTRQAKHVEARTKARFDHPTTKRTEAKHVEARTKARFDRSTTPKTTRPTTTPPHPRTAPPTTSPTCPPSLGVCDDAPGVDLSRREMSDIISSDTIATAFGLPSSAPPEARFAPQSRPAFPRIARILAPRGTHCRSAITRLEMPQILWFVDQWSLLNSSWIPSFIFFEGEGKQLASLKAISFLCLGCSHTTCSVVDTSYPSLIVVWLLTLMLLISGFVLPISLPPPLSGAPEPVVPISTPAVPVSDLPRPSQPQVADATSSTLSIMARLDTLQELFVQRRFCYTGDTGLEVDGGQVDGEIFIRAIDPGMDIIIWDDPPMVRDLGEAITPIVEITDQATTPMLEEIDGVVTPIIGADDHFYIYLIRYGCIHYGLLEHLDTLILSFDSHHLCFLYAHFCYSSCCFCARLVYMKSS
ncbi:hypothetical protein AAG906_006172 [Vitis piasezkii]